MIIEAICPYCDHTFTSNIIGIPICNGREMCWKERCPACRQRFECGSPGVLSVKSVGYKKEEERA